MPKRAEHTRLGLAVALALALLGVASWFWHQDRHQNRTTHPPVAAADASRPEPRCGPVLRAAAGGAGDHIDDERIDYSAAPPSFGDHRSRWEVWALPFYDVDNRPEVPVLVHNLEHGYNILWYDQTIADDSVALTRLRQIADGYASLGSGRDPATAFIAAPWTPQDGAAFPDGMHYAFTHWYADPHDPTRSRDDELGLTRYCANISADLVQEWMDDHPLSDAPEGNPDLM